MRRRALALLLTLATVVGGAVALGAAPASADPDLGAAVTAASAATAGRGQVGIAVLDRETGRLYENGDAHTRMRSASVVKIFVAENLLDRQRRGQITLDAGDRRRFESMVRSSDDAAMSALYSKYGLVQIVADVARKYGLTEIGPPPTPGYWGMFQISANDVVAFYRGMLDGGLVPADRDDLLGLMRGATPNGIDGFYQFFGIPDALGRGQTYGIKQGWMCCQEGQRRLHTTGILGPDARFAVAFTSQYSSSQSYEHGAQTLTAAVRTVFPDGVPPSGSTRNPVGALEAAGPTTPGTVGVRGWAYDPDSPTAALDVHVYVDGTGAAIARADGSRPDVGAAFPGAGPGHGYAVDVAVAGGPHQVCAYAINVGAGTSNPPLGCRSVVVRTGPVGSLDAVRVSAPRTVSVDGWTVDQDAPPTAVEVRVYVDGVGVAVGRTGVARPDVAAVRPGSPAAGFSLPVEVGAGRHTVCAYAINVPDTPGSNSTLGCRTVDVPAAPDLVGSFDNATSPASGTIAVSGWAISTARPTSTVAVHGYLDGTGVLVTTATAARPDVGAAFPAAGSAHGLRASIAAAPGAHSICLYAVPSTPGSAVLPLGCRAVTVG